MKIINKSQNVAKILPNYEKLLKLAMSFSEKEIVRKAKVSLVDFEAGNSEARNQGMESEVVGMSWPTGEVMIVIPEMVRIYPVTYKPFKRILPTTFHNYAEEFTYTVLHESRHLYQYFVKDHRNPEWDADNYASLMLPLLKSYGHFDGN